MRIGGYSHLNGVTFFCDMIKIEGRKKDEQIKYNIQYIEPPKWLKDLENKFILGGLVTAYYQWKILGRKIKTLFLILTSIYIFDLVLDLNFIDDYFNHYTDKYIVPIIIVAILILIVNYKKIVQTFKYHGAEHKVINSYLSNGYVNFDLARKAHRFNIRCGSNIASIFILLYIPIVVLKINSIIAIFITFLIAIQIMNVLAFKNFKWEKYVQALQWITVLEPTEEQLKLAVSTFQQLQKEHNLYKLKIEEGGA